MRNSWTAIRGQSKYKRRKRYSNAHRTPEKRERVKELPVQQDLYEPVAEDLAFMRGGAIHPDQMRKLNNPQPGTTLDLILAGQRLPQK